MSGEIRPRPSSLTMRRQIDYHPRASAGAAVPMRSQTSSLQLRACLGDRVRSRWSLPKLVRDENGQGVVEFALILPLLLLVIVGILEFGSIYSNIISVRQGVREAGRQGSVGQFGSIPSCGLSLIDSPTANMQNLMCLTKDQAGVQSGVKVRVRFDKPDLSAGGSFVAGNVLVICAAYPLSSLTGMLQPVLNGRVTKTKAAFRIESADPTQTYTAGGEADPSSQNWSWCI